MACSWKNGGTRGRLSMAQDTRINELPTSYDDGSEDFIPRLLVVGDEKMLVSCLIKDLEYKGLLLDTAATGEYGLARLREYPYVAVFCDMEAADPDDFVNFVRACRKISPSSKVVLICDNHGKKAAAEAASCGAAEVMEKPLDLSRLRQLLGDLLNYDRDDIAEITFEPPEGYRLVRKIHHGGLYAVFLAEKEGARYAIKVLIKHLFSMEKLKRFFREAGVLAGIQHPNIVKIYEYGLSEKGGIPYIVMEYVEGKSLQEIIKGGCIPLEKGVAVLRQIAMAMEAMHGHRILHRDIKPQNIMVGDDGEAKLTDFGIVHVLDSSLTATDSILGTPAYMAPEGFDSIKKVDERSDIFSLGIVAYEALTGHYPFSLVSIPGAIDSIRKERPPEPMKVNPRIHPLVQVIIGNMLEKNPERRYQSASEIIRDIDEFEKNKYFYRISLFRRLSLFLRYRHCWK